MVLENLAIIIEKSLNTFYDIIIPFVIVLLVGLFFIVQVFFVWMYIKFFKLVYPFIHKIFSYFLSTPQGKKLLDKIKHMVNVKEENW